MTERLARAAARLIRAGNKAYARRFSFLGALALVGALSFAALSSLGLTPVPGKPAAPQAGGAAAVSQALPEEPVKISIPTLDLSAAVADPTTTDTNALDALLLRGAVRYPTSALLGQQNGNVVIFGHSSYLPVVGNPAYKTFDGIQKLKAGDLITVYSSSRAYTYAVTSVAKESAAGDAGIPLTVVGEELTLSTCNSFATKSDRFVVSAAFVASNPLSS